MKWSAVIAAMCLAGCAGGSAQQNPNPTSTSITGVSVSATADSAIVPWTTNVMATSRVDYGLTTQYGSLVSDPSLVIRHSLTLNSLACNAMYHYKVTSVSAAGDSASTADATFTTNSCGTGGGGPTISNISVTSSTTSATVAWTTNIAATSKVDYGLTSSYGTTDSDPTLVTTHSPSLTGLNCSTTYHYRITSADGSGNSKSTTDSTFQTAVCGGPVSDDFHGSTLNTSLWTFVAPCCGSLRMNGNDALLVVPATTSHNDWTAGNQTIRLMQPTANVDFGLEVKFDSLPSVVSQDEGILIQTDVNNYMRFDVYFDGTTQHMFAASFVNNNPTIRGSVTISGAKAPFWMRVQRTGNTWTQSWSADGANFATVATFSYTLVVNQVGPYAGNCCGTNPALGLSTLSPSFTAAVDYFFNTASRISPSDGGMAQPPSQPVINVWYGDNQTFGQNGIPQQWVNILGNVTAPSGIQSASYTLNGSAAQFLRVGPNGSRLVDTGDFNVEIDHASLNNGINTVVITATDNQNHTITHTVTVNWNNTGQVWPLPYSIDWSTVTNIQNVAQVVDGQWAIQPDGTVRTTQVGYDRLLALGDVSWTDYQVTAEMTINSFDCWQFGPGVLVGWSGHTTDPTQPQPDQPRTGHPFFGLGWYATTGSQTAPNAQLEIYANSPSFHESVLNQDTTGFAPALGVKYMVKFAVQRNSGNTSSHLSLKIWPANGSEPSNWNLQADGDASTGSVILAAYRTDVSFGKIAVTSLP
jgi:regulation of enolase protein 1 (concanavalin A-like superfamily)